jgi:hypothetical protein
MRHVLGDDCGSKYDDDKPGFPLPAGRGAVRRAAGRPMPFGARQGFLGPDVLPSGVNASNGGW